MKKGMLILCLWLFLTDVMALRCGRQLVHTGDHKADVLGKCGEPDWVEHRTALRGSRLRHPYGALEQYDFEEVSIEEWTYNFGPREFKQFLLFENGILKSIQSLGYGF